LKKTVFILLFLVTTVLSSCSFFNKKPEKRNPKVVRNNVKNQHTKKDSLSFSSVEASAIIKSFIKLKGKNAQLVASWTELIRVAELVKQIDTQDLVTIDVFAEENYQACQKLLKSKIPKALDKPSIKSKLILLDVLSEKLARKTLPQGGKKTALEDAKLIANAFDQLVKNIKYELEEHPDFAKDLEEMNKYADK
jgi:uncharacterized protein YxeA